MADILIFEDEEVHIGLLTRTLKAEDRRLFVARDLQQAYDLLNQHEFNVVVADIRWENGDVIDKEAGLKLLLAAKSKNSNIQVILVTQYVSAEIGEKAIDGGAFDILDRNPVGLDFWSMLAAKVRLALHYHQLLTRDAACPA